MAYITPRGTSNIRVCRTRWGALWAARRSRRKLAAIGRLWDRRNGAKGWWEA